MVPYSFFPDGRRLAYHELDSTAAMIFGPWRLTWAIRIIPNRGSRSVFLALRPMNAFQLYRLTVAGSHTNPMSQVD